MDASRLKGKISKADDAIAVSPLAEHHFNQRYAGARFDADTIQARGWRAVSADEQHRNFWYERLFQLPGKPHIEFRVCLNPEGYWRDTRILLFDPEADPTMVRSPASDIPTEILQIATGVFDVAKTEEVAPDFTQELVAIIGDVNSSEIPPGATADDYRLAGWMDFARKCLKNDPTVARRLVSGFARYAHQCWSGEAIALAGFAAGELGMRTELVTLLRHALDSETRNTAGYWNDLGCGCYRLGILRESLECFTTAKTLDPGNALYQGNVWIIGRTLMPKLLAVRDFPGIVHCAQVMLDCAKAISSEERASYLCALGLGYEGKGDLGEAATYYDLAREVFNEKPGEVAEEPDSENGRAARFCPVAVFGLHRLDDPIPERRQEAFEAQVASFPKTPEEAGWLGTPPVTFIEEKYHGGHWGTVVDDVEGHFGEHLGKMIEQGTVEGRAEYFPAEISFHGYEQAQGLEFPPDALKRNVSLRVFLLLGLAAGKDGATFCSAFPVFGSGGFANLTMDRVYEYPNGLEADVRMLWPSRGIINFFVPDYYRDRGNFKGNFTYKVELAGFAYWMEPFKEQRWQIEKGPMLEREKERLREEGLPDDISSVEVVMDESASLLSPRLDSTHDADCEFVGKIVETTNFDFLGNKVHRVLVDFFPDRPKNLRLPIFIGEHKLKGLVPQVGATVTGILWLQGILREEVGPATPPEGEADDDAPWQGLVDWVKDLEEDRSPASMVRQALWRFRPDAIEDLPWQEGSDPQLVVRVSGRNLFVHWISSFEDSFDDLKTTLANGVDSYNEFGRARGVTVEHVAIGFLKQGDGYKILYAGFDELEEKEGWSTPGSLEKGTTST